MENFELDPILFIKKVRLIVTSVFLVVKRLKQESLIGYIFFNFKIVQNMTFDVRRSKAHEFDVLSRSVYLFAKINLL